MRAQSMKWLAVLTAVVSLAVWVSAEAGGGQQYRRGGGGGGSTSRTLSSGERTTMIYMRELEKLARDVYIGMFELWNAPVFSNISVSEQRHMDAILNLLNKYGVPDPTVGRGVGEFTDPGVQSLYDSLIARGRQSLYDAYLVGRDIEILDIDDLDAAIKEAAKTDLDNVYGNLRSASYNHLAAFNSHI